jgi:hypothetical protein
VKRRVVGSMTFTVDTGQINEGLLSYTVEGVTVTKRVNRYAFRANVLTGSYQGHVVMRSDDPRGLSYDDAKFTFDDHGKPSTSRSISTTGPKCTLSGIQHPVRRAALHRRPYTCAGPCRDLQHRRPHGHANGFTGHVFGSRRPHLAA